MDRTHDDFMKNMCRDPTVDQDKLRQYFGHNYTDMLRMKRIVMK